MNDLTFLPVAQKQFLRQIGEICLPTFIRRTDIAKVMGVSQRQLAL